MSYSSNENYSLYDVCRITDVYIHSTGDAGDKNTYRASIVSENGIRVLLSVINLTSKNEDKLKIGTPEWLRIHALLVSKGYMCQRRYVNGEGKE